MERMLPKELNLKMLELLTPEDRKRCHYVEEGNLTNGHQYTFLNSHGYGCTVFLEYCFKSHPEGAYDRFFDLCGYGRSTTTIFKMMTTEEVAAKAYEAVTGIKVDLWREGR